MILTEDAFSIESAVIKSLMKTKFRRENSEKYKEKIAELNGEKVSVYIHIPLCRSFCYACPYFKERVRKGIESKYVDALRKEIKLYGELLPDIKIVDIHFGGGTPSLISPEDYGKVIQELESRFDVKCRAGIEANPEDMRDSSKVSKFIDNGIGEISLGVQTFNERNLRYLGRAHSVEDSISAIQNCKESGIELLNIDLMYMLPGERIASWRKDLEIAQELDVYQITCYPLLVLKSTPIFRMMRRNEIPQQPDMLAFRRMFFETIEILRNYNQVELYSFAKGKRQYQTVELEMSGPLVALGAGGIGFTGNFEYANVHSVKSYLKLLSEERLPISVARGVSYRERAIRITMAKLISIKFKMGFEKDFSDISKFINLLNIFGLLNVKGDKVEINRELLFIFNRFCWAFVLNIPCMICDKLKKEHFPEQITVP